MTRSLAQKEQAAHNFLRTATYRCIMLGVKFTDDDIIDYATEQMGEEFRPLICRVHAREFKTYHAN